MVQPIDTDWNQIWGRDTNRAYAQGPSTRTRIRLARKLLKQFTGRGSSLLDVGCGNGLLLHDAGRDRNYERIAGIDISQVPLEMARSLNRVASFYLLDIQKEKLAEMFDNIVALATLDILEDDEAALRNISAMMNPGGFFIISVQAGSAPWSRLDRLRAWRRYHLEDLEVKCRHVGFKKIHAFWWGWPLYSWYYKILERYDEQMSQDKDMGLIGRIASKIVY